MFICVECGGSVNALYNSYGKDNIILERCPKCNEIADKYTEFDGMMKSVDLILHKVPVYRHILINSSLKLSGQQIGFFLVYMAMIEVHLRHHEKTDLYRSMILFSISVLYNLLFALFVWVIICLIGRLGRWENNFERIRNALILGTFPQILHLLFVVWDYPKNEQINFIINLATFTSHFTALSSIFPNSNVPLFAIIFSHVLVIQLKRFLPF